jgi:hypothetical protein
MGSLMMLRISGSSSSMVTTLGKSVSLVTLRSIIRIGSKVQFSQCKKRRLQHHHHQRSRVLVCRVVATATAAAQGEGTFTVKQKGTTVQGLPPAPSEASLTTVGNCLSLSLSLSLSLFVVTYMWDFDKIFVYKLLLKLIL